MTKKISKKKETPKSKRNIQSRKRKYSSDSDNDSVVSDSDSESDNNNRSRQHKMKKPAKKKNKYTNIKISRNILPSTKRQQKKILLDLSKILS